MSEPELTIEELTNLCAKYRKPGIRVELDPRAWYSQHAGMAEVMPGSTQPAEGEKTPG